MARKVYERSECVFGIPGENDKPGPKSMESTSMDEYLLSRINSTGRFNGVH